MYLVNLDFAKHSWNDITQNENHAKISAYVLAFQLLYIISMSFIKISVAVHLLRVLDRKYCAHMLNGIICKASTLDINRLD